MRVTSNHMDYDSESDGAAWVLEPLDVSGMRVASSSSEKILACTSRAMISRSLRAVAAWSHLHRAHFEWVWDGDNVWIVQLDFLAPRTNGVQPDSLVSREQRPSFTADHLSSFFVAGESEFEAYPKLKNARDRTSTRLNSSH